MYTKANSTIESELKRLFGDHVSLTPLISADRMGRRIHGVDMTRAKTADQAELLVSLLDHYNVISFPDQDQETFRLRHLETLANHFGAPIPHPKNYANYLDYKKNKTPLKLPPVEEQTCTQCDQAFPNALQCRNDANSPAVYIVTNLVGSGPDKQEETVGGLHWHTDIEFERHTSVDQHVLCASRAYHTKQRNGNLGRPYSERRRVLSSGVGNRA